MPITPAGCTDMDFLFNFQFLHQPSFFQTFFNSEACDLLNLYIKERKSKGEELTNDTWLFVSLRAEKDGKVSYIYNDEILSNLKPSDVFAINIKDKGQYLRKKQ